MRDRRSDYDVTDSVKTTDCNAVAQAIEHIYLELYGRAGAAALMRPFDDFQALYEGRHPHYRPCDTSYHDIQHSLEVTLAMARLAHGYERVSSGALGERHFRLCILVGLFHDFGYLRHRKDTRHQNGAEYTLTHVSRGARFLRSYLPQIGLRDLARVAGSIVHYTGYEIPIAKIRLPQPIFDRIGKMLGSADILAQMADRCYLEKCRERLFPEFVLGGIARQVSPEGVEKIVFASADDLITKTAGFYKNAMRRLDGELEGAYRYFEAHFGGRNYYVEAAENNANYALIIAAQGNMSGLRRKPPVTIGLCGRDGKAVTEGP